MSTLILTVGLPQSGKSTWAREYTASHVGVAHVDVDAVRMAFYGKQFIRKAEPWIWPLVRVMVEALFRSNHSTVIVNTTASAKVDRDWWKDSMWEVKFKRVDASLDVCLARAEHAESLGMAFPGLCDLVYRKNATFEELDTEEKTRELKE
jgi:predicted kinase